MTKKSDTPAIRFKGFTDTWEQRKLGELALFNPKDELPQIFEYVDLESVVGTEMLSHRTEVKSSAPSRAQRLAHTGDLYMTEEHTKTVVKDILENWITLSHNSKFHAIFATSSIPEAINYGGNRNGRE